MAIAVARRSDNPVVVNGYGEKEWLPGTHPLVRGYKCILEKGHTVSPKLYKDKTVVFIFGKGDGYITTPHRAYNIDELSFWVPNFDADPYSIYAVTDMEYMMVVVDMLESDLRGYENTHMILPMFKRLSEAEPYTQTCKGPNTKSWTIISSGHCARVLMGVVKADGEGTTEKGHLVQISISQLKMKQLNMVNVNGHLFLQVLIIVLFQIQVRLFTTFGLNIKQQKFQWALTNK